MKKMLKVFAFASALLVSSMSAAFAADYPSKPITLVCGYSAGGSSDLLCRILADTLQKKIGQSVVVKNVTGGGGWVAWMEMIKNTKPDGYTFCLINTPNYSLGKYDKKNPRPYDHTALDLLCNEVSDYNVIAIRTDETRYTDLKSLVEYARKNTLLVGSSASGIMSDDGTVIEMLNRRAGTKIRLVTTKGAKDNETFLMNKSADLLVGNISDVLVGKKNGTFKVLCVFAPERCELIADVPTARELGFDLVGSSSRGYALPHGVDPKVRETLYKALVESVNAPETIKALEDIGAATNFVPQEKYNDFLQNNVDTAKALYGVK